MAVYFRAKRPHYAFQSYLYFQENVDGGPFGDHRFCNRVDGNSCVQRQGNSLLDKKTAGIGTRFASGGVDDASIYRPVMGGATQGARRGHQGPDASAGWTDESHRTCSDARCSS